MVSTERQSGANEVKNSLSISEKIEIKIASDCLFVEVIKDMKILKGEEINKSILEKYKTHNKNRSVNARIYDTIGSLEIGEALEIAENEWLGYTKPSTSVHGITNLRGRGKKFPAYTYALSSLGRIFIGKRFTVRQIDCGYVVIRNEDRSCRKDFLTAVKSYDIFLEKWDKEANI